MIVQTIQIRQSPVSAVVAPRILIVTTTEHPIATTTARLTAIRPNPVSVVAEFQTTTTTETVHLTATTNATSTLASTVRAATPQTPICAIVTLAGPVQTATRTSMTAYLTPALTEPVLTASIHSPVVVMLGGPEQCAVRISIAANLTLAPTAHVSMT